jgi:hypothetical protein
MDNRQRTDNRRPKIVFEYIASEAGEEVADDLTKAEASEKIDELQHKTVEAWRSITHDPFKKCATTALFFCARLFMVCVTRYQV